MSEMYKANPNTFLEHFKDYNKKLKDSYSYCHNTDTFPVTDFNPKEIEIAEPLCGGLFLRNEFCFVFGKTGRGKTRVVLHEISKATPNNQYSLILSTENRKEQMLTPFLIVI